MIRRLAPRRLGTDEEATVVEHLTELRHRLLIAIAAIIPAFLLTFAFHTHLIEWLKQQPTGDHWQEDDWQQTCRDNFATTACALCALAKEGIWPTDRWREALQAWSDEKLIKRSWRYIAPILTRAPDDVLQVLAHGVSWWLKTIAKTFEGHKAHFFPSRAMSWRWIIRTVSILTNPSCAPSITLWAT